MNTNLILQYFKDVSLTRKTLNKFFKFYPDVEKEVDEFLDIHPFFVKKYYIISCIVNNINLLDKKCKFCHNQLDYFHRNSTYCSHKCMISDPEYQKKRMKSYENTCVKKYRC